MAEKEKIISPKFSLCGWRFETWFVGNWSTIKELLKVGIPLAISWAATKDPVLVTVFTIGGKLILDTGEYFFKEYK